MIGGVAGDQQSALFGQACFTRRHGQEHLRHRLLHADAHRAQVPDLGQRPARPPAAGARSSASATEFATEGSVFVGGAVVQWLRDGLRAIKGSGEVQALAESVPDSGGVMMVPAFTGLGAPYWKPDARGTITGLTRGTTVAHIARAALESIAYQSAALLQAMSRDAVAAGARAGERAAGGRRRLRQRPADAVPGRPAGHPGGAAGRDRNHGAGRGLPGGPGQRRLPQHRGTLGPVAGRAALPADAGRRAAPPNSWPAGSTRCGRPRWPEPGGKAAEFVASRAPAAQNVFFSRGSP